MIKTSKISKASDYWENLFNSIGSVKELRKDDYQLNNWNCKISVITHHISVFIHVHFNAQSDILANLHIHIRTTHIYTHLGCTHTQTHVVTYIDVCVCLYVYVYNMYIYKDTLTYICICHIRKFMCLIRKIVYVRLRVSESVRIKDTLTYVYIVCARKYTGIKLIII